MKKNWVYIISPCIIALIALIVGIIESLFDAHSSQGWSIIGVMVGVPFFILIIGIDFLLKMAIKRNVILLWSVEIILIIICFFFFRKFRG